MAADDRNSQYVLVFLVLVTLTTLELAVIGFGIDRAARITALVGLAMAKVAALLLYFMHLRSASLPLKLVAALPLVLAPSVAVVLMVDAVYRATAGR